MPVKPAPSDAEALFWELAEPLLADPAVTRSTMMGLPCLRRDGRFFASFDRRGQALLVKLPQTRVAELIASGAAVPFAPAGRVFREWAAAPTPDPPHWSTLLAEANAFAVPFTGLPDDGLAFLAELEHNNNKPYFDANRDRYEALFEAARQLVVTLGAHLRGMSPGIQAVPRIGGSLFRINRDLRFSADKRPYKTWLDIIFWEGSQPPRDNPVLMLRIAATEVTVGAGLFSLRGARLERYRSAVADPVLGAEIVRMIDDLCQQGATLNEPTRARIPAGHDPAGPAADLLRRDGFQITRVQPRPAETGSPEFVSWCTAQLAPFAPAHRWLVTALSHG